MSKLKPCPFCGSEESYHHRDPETRFWIVGCDICGGRTDYYLIKGHATAAWNRRAKAKEKP